MSNTRFVAYVDRDKLRIEAHSETQQLMLVQNERCCFLSVGLLGGIPEGRWVTVVLRAGKTQLARDLVIDQDGNGVVLVSHEEFVACLRAAIDQGSQGVVFYVRHHAGVEGAKPFVW